MADDFRLKWDATNQQLYGEDPSTGNRIAIPLDSVEIEKETLEDTGTDPSANGEIQRNGGDIKAHSGGSVRNLSNIGSGGGSTSLTEAIETGKAYADDGTVYSTVSDAVTNASSFVFVGPGSFNEAVTISTTNLRLVGSGRATLIDGGTNGDAIRASASGVTVSNLALKTTSGGGTSKRAFHCFGANGVSVDNVYVEESDDEGVFWNNSADGRIVSAWCDSPNIDGDGLVFNSGSDGNIVDDIIGVVKDNGTNNTIGETA